MSPTSDRGCLASLNYLAPGPARVRTYACDPPPGQLRFDGVLQARQMGVGDARAASARGELRLGLEACGFDLVRQPSRVSDLWDEAALRQTVYAEAEGLVRELTGASAACCFDHTLRRRAPGRPPLDGLGGSFAPVREPVGRVHLDYTPVSAPQRLRQVLGQRNDGALAERILAGHWWIIGLWRPTGAAPLQDAPLALADRHSLRRDELVPNDLIYADRQGQSYAVRHHERHRWYYLPGQTRDEVTAFVHYDSLLAHNNAPGAVLHTAFDHPATPPEAPPRASLELRVLAWRE